MDHIAYINYFEGKARSHFLLQHDADLPGSPSGKRVSFFRMNSNMEIQNATSVQVDYPIMALSIYRGKLAEVNAMVSDVMTGFVEIRMKVDNPLEFDQIETARQTCKQIGLDIFAGMVQELEELGACGPIGYFDPNSVQYDFTGPLNDSEYGCLFLFEFSDTAFNALTADLTHVFL